MKKTQGLFYGLFVVSNYCKQSSVLSFEKKGKKLSLEMIQSDIRFAGGTKQNAFFSSKNVS